MKISQLLALAFSSLLFITACSDKETESIIEEVPTEVTASKTALATFQKSDAYYQMYVYRYDSTTTKWTSRIASHFSTIPSDDSTYLGFTNPYVLESGVNLFGMVTLYQEALGSNNIKEARINAEKVLQFFPSETGATSGTVKVLAQDIAMRRKDGNPDSILIPISGEGTYDEETKVIDLVIKFDETAIGGSAAVYRKYKLSVDALSLN